MLHKNPTATIQRLCTDIIIKQNGEISVLEIGAFPTSGFTGHDRNNPALYKRQEALLDLQRYAKQINVPIFFLGQSDILNPEAVDIAKEKAGLYGNTTQAPENYFTNEFTLIDKINLLPDKDFIPGDLSTYKCIVISLDHIKLGFSAIFSVAMPYDDLENVRKIPQVMLVDDKHLDAYQAIFDSKVITSLFLNDKFKPKTFIIPRVYDDTLADRVMAYFAPATKILVKPSHSARGIGIVTLSLTNRDALDLQLQNLLKQNLLAKNAADTRSNLRYNIETQPEHYWYEKNVLSEPTLILQEFIDSQPVHVNKNLYQAVTRVVFTYIRDKGQDIFLIHGNPYHKIAAANLEAKDIQAASISKVHSSNGPEPMIVTDQQLVTAVNHQIEDCFKSFFSKALQYKNKDMVLAEGLESKDSGIQLYAMIEIMQSETIAKNLVAKIKTILLANPSYLQHYFEAASKSPYMQDKQSPIFLLTHELIQANPLPALLVMGLEKSVSSNFSHLLEEKIAPQFESLWANTSLNLKINLIATLLKNPGIEDSNDRGGYTPATNVPSASLNLYILEKLHKLVFSNNAEIAIPVMMWMLDKAYYCMCTIDKKGVEECEQSHPFHQSLKTLLAEYQSQADKASSIYQYISFLITYHFKYPRMQNGNFDELVAFGTTIIDAFHHGQCVNYEIETSCNVFVWIRINLTRNLEKYPILFKMKPEALRLYLLTEWMEWQVGGYRNEEIQRNWLQKCSAFDYFDKKFLNTQDVIDAAWNTALNFAVNFTEDDEDPIQQALFYIVRVLIKNNFILFNTDNIQNYPTIKATLAKLKDMNSQKNYQDSFLEEVLSKLQAAENRSRPSVYNSGLTHFVSSNNNQHSTAVSQLSNSEKYNTAANKM